ncbi:hypothetical protein BDQ17DRAFT_1375228 [Cyathus striatus]|nr:hypothetical protein BDQ17DRAFT_1375228 [Cyathus striatus]
MVLVSLFPCVYTVATGKITSSDRYHTTPDAVLPPPAKAGEVTSPARLFFAASSRVPPNVLATLNKLHSTFHAAFA